MAVDIRINGRVQRLEDVAPDTPLLLALRNDAGLHGVRYGCGAAQCGACTVLVDGNAVPSCITPVSAVREAAITTLEGLGTAASPHPLQSAFLAEQAAQCGYCTAGMIVTAAGLLRHNPDPSDDEIRTALARNLCRCGTYDRILRAVRRAAAAMRQSAS